MMRDFHLPAVSLAVVFNKANILGVLIFANSVIFSKLNRPKTKIALQTFKEKEKLIREN